MALNKTWEFLFALLDSRWLDIPSIPSVAGFIVEATRVGASRTFEDTPLGDLSKHVPIELRQVFDFEADHDRDETEDQSLGVKELEVNGKFLFPGGFGHDPADGVVQG